MTPEIVTTGVKGGWRGCPSVHTNICICDEAIRALEAELAYWKVREQRQFEAWIAMRNRVEKAEAERDALKARLRWSEGQWMEEYDTLKVRVAELAAMVNEERRCRGNYQFEPEGGGRESGSQSGLDEGAISAKPGRAAANPAAHLHRGEYCYHHGMRFDVEACEERDCGI